MKRRSPRWSLASGFAATARRRGPPHADLSDLNWNLQQQQKVYVPPSTTASATAASHQPTSADPEPDTFPDDLVRPIPRTTTTRPAASQPEGRVRRFATTRAGSAPSDNHRGCGFDE